VTLFEPGDASPARTGAAEARTHLALVVAYDGTDFHGFAAQPEQRTVAGVLLEALDAMLRGDVEDFACAGRTDAGVHAWGQVVSLSTAAEVDPGLVGQGRADVFVKESPPARRLAAVDLAEQTSGDSARN